MRKSDHPRDNKRKEQKHSREEYLQKKERSLSPEETLQVRAKVGSGQTNVYKLADEFGCVPAQIAGIKARLKF